MSARFILRNFVTRKLRGKARQILIVYSRSLSIILDYCC